MRTGNEARSINMPACYVTSQRAPLRESLILICNNLPVEIKDYYVLYFYYIAMFMLMVSVCLPVCAHQVSVDETIGLKILHGRTDLGSHV